MARVTKIIRVCDRRTHRGEAPEATSTANVDVDGRKRRLDLCGPCAEELARFAAVRRHPSTRGASSSPKARRASDAGAVREWAAANGYELKARGRIPAEVTAAYRGRRQRKAAA